MLSPYGGIAGSKKGILHLNKALSKRGLLGKLAGMVAATLLITAILEGQAFAGQKYKLLRLDGQIVKWGAPRLASPAHVTYAFADDTYRDLEARNCKGIARLDTLAARNGLSSRQIEMQANAAFDQWAGVAGITFERIDDPQAADILIGAQVTPRGYAFANVRTHRRIADRGGAAGEMGLDSATTTEPQPVVPPRSEIASIEKSAICLNPERDWKIGTRDGAPGYDLRFTFTHEIGHAIGLDHYVRPGQIMNFRYSEEIDGPQVGDVNGLRALYGPPQGDGADG